MSFNSSLLVGLVRDLMLQRLWYLAAAVTDTDLERGLDGNRSWFVRFCFVEIPFQWSQDLFEV